MGGEPHFVERPLSANERLCAVYSQSIVSSARANVFYDALNSDRAGGSIILHVRATRRTMRRDCPKTRTKL
jgi:hypothetical protein